MNGEAKRLPDSGEEPELHRRAHAVLRQRHRLSYTPPRLTPIEQGAEIVPLASARARRQLTIQALSTRSGVSLSTIYRIESGRSRPRLHVVRALSASLEVEPQQISEFREVIAKPVVHT